MSLTPPSGSLQVYLNKLEYHWNVFFLHWSHYGNSVHTGWDFCLFQWLQLTANENPKDQFNQMSWSQSGLLLHKLLHQCSVTWRRSSESGFIRYFSFSLYAGTLIYQIKCRNSFWKQVVPYTHFFLPLNFLSVCLNIALCEQKKYLYSIIFVAFPPY